MKRLLLATLFLEIVLTGCSHHIYRTKSPYLITIKSDELKFSDMGFIAKSEREHSVLVTIFSLGNQVLKLEIDQFISIDDGTPIPPSIFNSKYLNSDYPSNTLRDIFLGKPIFNSQNIIYSEKSFSQEINSIKYRVSESEIYFKDRDRRILIKLQKR